MELETWVGQPTYIQAIVKKFGLEHCKPVTTPMTPGTKLLKATEQSKMADAALYQSAVGSLLYLSGWTRLDISFAVSSVARFCSSNQGTLDCGEAYLYIPEGNIKLWFTLLKEC